ncbi:MAG: hypothetical protein MR356_02940 [Agathobacter sp.]|nr:hypothetical protein [Agathobacter sp.]
MAEDIWIDESRVEEFEQDGSKREVPVHFYYPDIEGDLTLPMPKGRGFLVAAESVSADQFVSDRSYPKLGLCHQPS